MSRERGEGRCWKITGAYEVDGAFLNGFTLQRSALIPDSRSVLNTHTNSVKSNGKFTGHLLLVCVTRFYWLSFLPSLLA